MERKANYISLSRGTFFPHSIISTNWASSERGGSEGAWKSKWYKQSSHSFSWISSRLFVPRFTRSSLMAGKGANVCVFAELFSCCVTFVWVLFPRGEYVIGLLFRLVSSFWFWLFVFEEKFPCRFEFSLWSLGFRVFCPTLSFLYVFADDEFCCFDDVVVSCDLCCGGDDNIDEGGMWWKLYGISKVDMFAASPVSRPCKKRTTSYRYHCIKMPQTKRHYPPGNHHASHF